MRFEWDPEKAASNVSKHGVSFEEAQTVFQDALFVAFEDPDHSRGESRLLIMGQSAEKRLLVALVDRLGPVARPLFGWNHDLIMLEGARALARRLGAELLDAQPRPPRLVAVAGSPAVQRAVQRAVGATGALGAVALLGYVGLRRRAR